MHKIVFFVLLFQLTTCYKILVYAPQLSRSHITFMGRIADTLADVGHDVVVFSPEFAPNVTMVPLKKARAVIKPRIADLGMTVNTYVKALWNEKRISFFSLLRLKQMQVTYLGQLCESVLNDAPRIERLRLEKFDLGVTEHIDLCGIAFIEKIGLQKFIVTESLSLNEVLTKPLGIDNNPSYIPTMFSPYSDEMNYWERLMNFGYYVSGNIIEYYTITRAFRKLVRKHLGNNFDLTKKLQTAAYAMVNSDEYVDFPRPITHKIVYIGGIGARRLEPLDNSYKVLLDKAVNGAVFVSFGSIMKSELMPATTKEALVSTFRKFPQIQFIWKYEINDTVGSGLPNLIKVKWAPQNDLLNHPNLKAFITHGGLNSITESVNAGVPTIVVPIFADQFRNAKMVEKRGVARIINKNEITEDSLVAALDDVLNNERYWNTAKRLQKIIMKKPTSPVERLIKYAEFAVEFGHIDNLDSASTKLNFIQYYLLDIFLPLGCIVLLCFGFSATVLYKLRNIVLFKKSKKE